MTSIDPRTGAPIPAARQDGAPPVSSVPSARPCPCGGTLVVVGALTASGRVPRHCALCGLGVDG